MADVLKELRSVLSHHLLGHSYDRSSIHEEKFLIDDLVEQVRYWELGGYTYPELRTIFSRHDLKGFDLDAWIKSKADEGEYFLPDELA